MPREGKATRVIDIVRRDIPTCALNDRLGDISEKVLSAGKNVCVVLNDEQIVLGRVRGKAFDGDPDTKVEDASGLDQPRSDLTSLYTTSLPACTIVGSEATS